MTVIISMCRVAWTGSVITGKGVVSHLCHRTTKPAPSFPSESIKTLQKVLIRSRVTKRFSSKIQVVRTQDADLLSDLPSLRLKVFFLI